MVSCFGVLVSDLCYSNEDEYEDAPCAAVEPGSLTCFAGGKYCAPAGPAAALLFIKTTADRVNDLREALLTLHPYDVPEVLVLDVDTEASTPGYVDWVRKCVKA